MLTQEQIAAVRSLAYQYDIPADLALAFISKESAGNVYWTVDGEKRPAIRPEAHYFYRLLTDKHEQALAVRQGLASPKAGAIKVPSSYAGVYGVFERMKAINETAALQSISMGLGQVMGENWSKLGYRSVQDMWAVCHRDFAGQIELMFRFLRWKPGMMQAIRERNYPGMARLYNGNGYKRNNYDVELRRYADKWAHDATGTSVSREPDKTMSAVFARILKLGYESVSDFQEQNGLKVDGVIGPMTTTKLEELEKAATKVQNKPVVQGAQVGATAFGVGILAWAWDAVLSVMNAAQPLLDSAKSVGINGNVVAVVAGAACVGAIGYSVYRWRLSKL